MAKDQTTQRREEQRDARLKLSGLTKIAQFRFNRWANRRQVEWKTSASVWAFLVAISSAMAFKNVTVPFWPLFFFLLILFSGHFWWVHQNWIRNQSDIRAAFDLLEEAQKLVSASPLIRERNTHRWIFQDAIPAIQFWITALLCIVVLYVASILPLPSATR